LNCFIFFCFDFLKVIISYNDNVSKDNKVFIYWCGKQVTILKDKRSNEFLARIKNADLKETQLIMAKVTGNFKHGNKRK